MSTMTKTLGRVCLIGYASQPTIQFLCDEAWSTPSWGTELNLEANIHVADDNDRLYTFEAEKVTCEHCLAKMKEKENG